MDWNKVKSAVATVGGLDVTFEDGSGQLGAVRMPYASQRSPVRQKPFLTPTLPVSDCPSSATDYRVFANEKLIWSGIILPGMCIDITYAGSLTVVINKQWLALQVMFMVGETPRVEKKPAIGLGLT